MVIHSALVRSHQSASARVASASCVPRGYNTARLSRVRPSIKRKPDVRGATPFVYFVCVRCSRGHCYPLTGSQSGPWPRHFVCIYPINLGIVTPLRMAMGLKWCASGGKARKQDFRRALRTPKKVVALQKSKKARFSPGKRPPQKVLASRETERRKRKKARFFPGGLALRFNANGGPAAPMPIGLLILV